MNLSNKKGLYILFFILIMATRFGYSLEQEDEDYLHVGGALRLNIASVNYEYDPVTTDTYATMDTWRMNFSANLSDVILDFEYRFYPTFNTHFIHHGYLGYNFTENLNMQLGVTRVPFGNLAYNSHSWWFLIPYYLGLEDDYNMGIKFTYDIDEKLNLKTAYFRQSDPAGPAYGSASFGGPTAGTYSYNVIPGSADISPEGITSSIRELNQFNLRLEYEVREGTYLGFSGQVQGLYNSVLDDTEYGNAMAAHLNSNFRNFNLQLQYTAYNYKARDDEGNIMDRVQMGAYGDPYYGDGVASGGTILTAGFAYEISVDWGPISSILPYIDYSLMTKDGELEVNGSQFDFQNSYMMVPGLMITAGGMYTYVDLAMGKNHPWLTGAFGTGMGAGHLYGNEQEDYYYDEDKAGQPVPVGEMDWNMRFNINVGYYF